MIAVLCLKELDNLGEISLEDMKNTLQIMHLEPHLQMNWPGYNYFLNK